MTAKEEAECQTLAKYVKTGARTGIVVDDDAKANRFVKRIMELCPHAVVLSRGPFAGAVALVIKIPTAKPSNN